MTLCEGRGKMAAQRNTRSLCLFESEEICVCKIARTVVNIAVPFMTMIRKRFQPFLVFLGCYLQSSGSGGRVPVVPGLVVVVFPVRC